MTSVTDLRESAQAAGAPKELPLPEQPASPPAVIEATIVLEDTGPRHTQNNGGASRLPARDTGRPTTAELKRRARSIRSLAESTCDDDVMDGVLMLVAKEGCTAKAAAAYFGVTDRALYQALLKHRPGQLEEAEKEYAASLVEEALVIVDDRTGDMTTRRGRDGKEYEAVDYENIARSKLRAETRLRLAASYDPDKWSTKQQLDHKGNVTFLANSPLLADDAE